MVYDASGFLEKNRDRLAGEVINVLRMSQIALVRTLFNSPITKTGECAPLTARSHTDRRSEGSAPWFCLEAAIVTFICIISSQSTLN